MSYRQIEQVNDLIMQKHDRISNNLDTSDVSDKINNFLSNFTYPDKAEDIRLIHDQYDALKFINIFLDDPTIQNLYIVVNAINDIANWNIRTQYQDKYIDKLVGMTGTMNKLSDAQLKDIQDNLNNAIDHKSDSNILTVNCINSNLTMISECRLYNRNGMLTDKTVQNNEQYMIYEKAYINGELMYRIGRNQWIPKRFSMLDNTSTSTNFQSQSKHYRVYKNSMGFKLIDPV